MALDSYSALLSEVSSGWLRRNDLAPYMASFVRLTEANINRELRVSFQLVAAPYSITGEFVDKPPAFRQMRSLRMTSGSGAVLREVTPEQMAAEKVGPNVLRGQPRIFTAIGAQFEFFPVPDQTYPAVIEYQQGFTPLSDDNPSNWLLADHADVYLWGVLAAANAFLKKLDEAAGFQAQFEAAMGEVQQALRTSFDRKLRVDRAALGRRRPFNILTGDY